MEPALPGSLPTVDKFGLVLAEGAALALGASAIVWLWPPDGKGPEELLVGAVPADARVPGAVVGLGGVLKRLMPGPTAQTSEVDDIAVIEAFPLLGMVDALLDRRVFDPRWRAPRSISSGREDTACRGHACGAIRLTRVTTIDHVVS